jgi:hypothetical protein
MERMEKAGEDLGKEARFVWKPLTIRLEDIEGRHRNENYLRYKWMYGKRGSCQTAKRSIDTTARNGQIIDLERASM